jgi:hypothetical protein
MSALTLPLSDPSFLSPVGKPERTAWRIVAGLVLALVLTMVGTAAVLALCAVVDPRSIEVALAAQTAPLSGSERLYQEARFMAVLAATLAVAAAAFVLAGAIVFRRPVSSFVAPVRPFSLRLLGLGFVVYGGLLAAALAVSVLLGDTITVPVLDPTYDLHQRLLYAGAAVFCLLIAAASEEVLCRGLLLQMTGAFTRRRMLLALINGLVFSALHLDFAPAPFLSRALMGAVWAWAVLELGGLEFGVGAHFAHNLLLVLLVEPLSAAVAPGQPYPLTDSLQDVATGLLTLAAVRVIARRLETDRLQA